MNPRTAGGFSRRACGALGSAFFTILFFSGCASGDRPPAASAMKHPVLEDVPLPNGFKLVDDQSMARASGRMRIARVKFVGPTERAAVMRFFEEYMPRAGFELRHTGFDRGMYEMRFESSNEECTVRVLPERSKTAIYVELGPLALESASREPPPEEMVDPTPPSASDAGVP